MRVKEVRFEKLFNIGDFNNERIGFTVELSENEDENKVVAELYFRIVQIEDALQLYRMVEARIGRLSEELMDIADRIRVYETDLKTVEESIRQLEEKNADLLDKAYKLKSKKDLEERLAENKKAMEEVKAKLEALVKIRGEIRRRIKNGDFNVIELLPEEMKKLKGGSR